MSTFVNKPFTPDNEFLFPYPFSYNGKLKEYLESQIALKLLAGASSPKQKTTLHSWIFLTASLQPDLIPLLSEIAPYPEVHVSSTGFYGNISHALTLEEQVYLKRKDQKELRELAESPNRLEYLNSTLSNYSRSRDIVLPYLSAYKEHLQANASLEDNSLEGWKPNNTDTHTEYLVELLTQQKPFTKGAKMILRHPAPKSTSYYTGETDTLISGPVRKSCGCKYKVLVPEILPVFPALTVENFAEQHAAILKLPYYIAFPHYVRLVEFLKYSKPETVQKFLLDFYLSKDPSLVTKDLYLGSTPEQIPFLLSSQQHPTNRYYTIRLYSLIPFVYLNYRSAINFERDIVGASAERLEFAGFKAAEKEAFVLISDFTSDVPPKLSKFTKLSPKS